MKKYAVKTVIFHEDVTYVFQKYMYLSNVTIKYQEKNQRQKKIFYIENTHNWKKCFIRLHERKDAKEIARCKRYSL